MSEFKGELRPTERDNAVCRGCYKKLSKGEDVIAWYSSCNRGMNIILCVDCCKVIGEVVKI